MDNVTIVKSALSLSQIRLFKKEILEKKYKIYLDDVFKGKNRLYLDFKKPTVKSKKPPRDIGNFLKKEGYEVVDYIKGLAKKDKGNNLIRIGKILNKKERDKLLKKFNEDPSRIVAQKDSLMIAISRHPYDIISMSTGRGWISCMHLEKGHINFIREDIKYGSLIAYLIDSKDWNINRPIGRLMLKPFTKGKKTILYPDKKVYGTNVKGFREVIIKWLSTFQKSPKGTYKINPKLYQDDNVYKSINIGKKGKKSKIVDHRLTYYETHPEDKDAKIDEDLEIRKLYHTNYPEDEDAKTDFDWEIREIYYTNHPEDEDAKRDEDWGIRKLYYTNYPEDEDVKKDESWIVREWYYRNNPEDKDAKKDEDWGIKYRYYKDHPEDEDIKKNKDWRIRKLYSKNHSKII